MVQLNGLIQTIWSSYICLEILPISPIIGVSEPEFLTTIYKWICNFDEYRALGQKPPKKKSRAIT